MPKFTRLKCKHMCKFVQKNQLLAPVLLSAQKKSNAFVVFPFVSLVLCHVLIVMCVGMLL